MAEIIKRNKALSVSPLKASQPVGATLATLGMHRAIPMLHGSQGCTAFAKVYFARHFREPGHAVPTYHSVYAQKPPAERFFRHWRAIAMSIIRRMRIHDIRQNEAAMTSRLTDGWNESLFVPSAFHEQGERENRGEDTVLNAALAAQAEDSERQSEMVAELVKQMRALDTYDIQKDWPDGHVIGRFVLTKERRAAIPLVGDPDEETLARVKAYYNALATLIEKKSGLMAVPFINLTHEGFGRALVTVGRLVVVDKTLRDVHRFGFPSLAKLNEESAKLVGRATALIEQYLEVANA